MKILINGINNSSAGGKTVFLNLIKGITNYTNRYKFLVLLPNSLQNEIKELLGNTKAELIVVKKPNLIDSIYWYFVGLPRIISKRSVDVTINLGDIPIYKPNCKQIFYFDWPHAIYPESTVWKLFSFKTKISKKIKLYVFKKLFIYNHHIITQTKTAAERLKKYYPLKSYSVLNNPVSEIQGVEEDVQITFEDSYFYLFCLTRYYEHKNLESIIPLAKVIKDEKVKVRILITIDESQGNGAKKLLRNIRLNKLEDVVINVGEINLRQVLFLYHRIDALFLPTLLESFSGTYVESMFFKKPILTTDIDFAKEICGKGAIYFNPFDTKEQLNAIKSVIKDPDIITRLVQNQSDQMKGFINWEIKTSKIMKTIKIILNE